MKAVWLKTCSDIHVFPILIKRTPAIMRFLLLSHWFHMQWPNIRWLNISMSALSFLVYTIPYSLTIFISMKISFNKCHCRFSIEDLNVMHLYFILKRPKTQNHCASSENSDFCYTAHTKSNLVRLQVKHLCPTPQWNGPISIL